MYSFIQQLFSTVFSKKVSKIGLQYLSENIYSSKSFYVSKLGNAGLTSTQAENSFFRAHAVLQL